MIEIILDHIRMQLLGGREDVQLTSKDDLLEIGLIDSMGMMSLIAFIENRFKIKIPPQEMTIKNFKTIEAIAIYIKRQKAT